MSKPSQLILFDLDGTLVGSIEKSKAINISAVSKIVGKPVDATRYSFDGKTDPQNLKALLELAGLPEDDISTVLPEVIEQYNSEIESEFGPGSLAPLSGVVELLRLLSRRSDLLIGVLTGNTMKSANTKLRAAGIERFIRFGVFGSDNPDRYELPRIAQARAKDLFGMDFRPSDMVIVGDTLHDIGCARRFGTWSIAVATGIIPMAELEKGNPDALLPDLSNTEQFLTFLAQFSIRAVEDTVDVTPVKKWTSSNAE